MNYNHSSEFEPGELLVWEALQRAFPSTENTKSEDDISKYLEVAYHGLPVLGQLGQGDKEPDIAILTKKLGLIVIEVKDATIDQIYDIEGYKWWMEDSWYLNRKRKRNESEHPIKQARDQMFAMINMLQAHQGGLLLDDQGSCLIKGNFFCCLPYVSEREFTEKFGEDQVQKILFKENLEGNSLVRLGSMCNFIQPPISDQLFAEARSAISGARILPRKDSRPPRKKDSKMAFLRKARMGLIPIMSNQQETTGSFIPDGPQKIRGLAGTGKTIVMAMKAATILSKYPEWNVLLTFPTKNLKYTLEPRIAKFFSNESPDEKYDETLILNDEGVPKNLDVLHAHALASKMAKRFGAKEYPYPKEFSTYLAITANNILDKIYELQHNNEYIPPFDCVLADETMDLPDAFMKLLLLLSRESRFIWGVDELQQLGDLELRDDLKTFGLDAEGKPLVDLSGTYFSGMAKSIMLNVVYRTPRPILVLAHVFGLGLNREEGAIQGYERVSQWRDLGYDIKGNEGDLLVPGMVAQIFRPKRTAPHVLENLVNYEKVVNTASFNSFEEEVQFIADQIVDDIKNQEVEPEEILVMHLDYRKGKTRLPLVEEKLISLGIEINTNPTNFKEKGKVSIQTLRRSKGNEAGIVYLMGAEAADGPFNLYELTRRRNFAFMAMTRSSGYLTVTGSGQSGEKVIKEIQKILAQKSEVEFTIPDLQGRRQLYSKQEQEYLRQRSRKNKERNVIKKKLEDPNTSKEKRELLMELLEEVAYDAEEDLID